MFPTFYRNSNKLTAITTIAVTRPSEKLWIPTAKSVNNPIIKSLGFDSN